MDLIKRDLYLDKLKMYTDTDFIKVITGIRRCGKSSILALYNEYLCNKFGYDKVLQINIDTPDYISIDTPEKFADMLKTRITSEIRYILLDEVQLIPGWERVVNAYYATKKYDITITGSNAQMLSSNLATHLTGRYIEIEILPLSYKEFLSFKGYQAGQISFDEYLVYGGFPSIVLLNGTREKSDSLKAIMDSILYNDVLKRNRSLKPNLLDRLIRFLNDSIGYPVSLNKIVHTLKSVGYKVYYELIAEYINMLSDAYMYFPTQFYNIKGRERFGLVDKLYSIDTGFINLTKSKSSENYGSLLENAVFLELRRRGYDVSIGRDDTLEVDFVATKANDTFYYQVTETLLDPVTREREFRSLVNIKDNYPKYIISMDIHDYSQNGIKNINMIDFLISE